MRDPVLKEAVVISRDPRHFIFSVETVGMMTAVEVLIKSLQVLKGKGEKLKEVSEVGVCVCVRERPTQPTPKHPNPKPNPQPPPPTFTHKRRRYKRSS